MSNDDYPNPNDEHDEDEDEDDVEECQSEDNDAAADLFNAIAAAGVARFQDQAASNLGDDAVLPEDFLHKCFLEAVSLSPWDGGGMSIVSVGDSVWSTFSEDGLWYKAEVISVREDRNSVQVRYHGYGNEEEVPMDMFRPAP